MDRRKTLIGVLVGHVVLGLIAIVIAKVARWPIGYDIVILGWFLIVGAGLFTQIRMNKVVFVVLWSWLTVLVLIGIKNFSEQEVIVINESGQPIIYLAIFFGDEYPRSEPLYIGVLASGEEWHQKFYRFLHRGELLLRGE